MAAMQDSSPREDEPTHDGDSSQNRRDRVIKQHGGGDRTSEGSEICHDVIDRGHESLVHDMGYSDEDATGKRHGQEDTDHGRSLAYSRPIRLLETAAPARNSTYGCVPGVVRPGLGGGRGPFSPGGTRFGVFSFSMWGLPSRISAEVSEQFRHQVVLGVWGERGGIGAVLPEGLDDGVGGGQ